MLTPKGHRMPTMHDLCALYRGRGAPDEVSSSARLTIGYLQLWILFIIPAATPVPA
jgi:hypothetical protein